MFPPLSNIHSSPYRHVVNVLDQHNVIFDPKEEENGFFFKGAKQRCRDITKKQPLEKKFVFEQVFGEDATNLDVYHATAHPLVDTLLQGYNCSGECEKEGGGRQCWY